MELKMITFHTPKNYGAVLQAYSLFQYFQSQGLDVELIDFNTKHLRSVYPLLQKPKSFKGLARLVLSLPSVGKKKRKYKKFEKFVESSFAKTKRFESFGELCAYPWKAGTVFSTGSDQVFNPGRIEEERKAFYLDFVPENCYKFSYAASFGVSVVKQEVEKETKEYLEKFNKIAVREKSGVEIVNRLIGKTPTEVLDPVFLHEKEFWKSVGADEKKIGEPYLLYYRLMKSDRSDRLAVETAQKLGKKLVVITDDSARIFKNAKVLKDVGPKEFLALYSGADYVVTNSFHGVAFSVIFEKQFAYVDFSEKNERGLNLIEKLQVSDNVLPDAEGFGTAIDFAKVRQILDGYKKEAYDYIEDALREAKLFSKGDQDED